MFTIRYLPDDEDEAEAKAKAEADGQSRPSYIRLNDTDELYRDLRDFNISAVGSGLTRVGRETTELYNSRPNAQGSLTSIQVRQRPLACTVDVENVDARCFFVVCRISLKKFPNCRINLTRFNIISESQK